MLFGSDASGKSTQAALLSEYLKQKHKHKVYLTSISFRHLIMYFIYKIFNKLGRKIQVAPRIIVPLLPTDRVRLSLEFLSIALLVLRIRILKMLGYIVIIEKYIPFTVASLAYIYGVKVLKSSTIKMLLRFMHNTRLIRLDVDYAVHFNRRGIIAENKRWITFQRNIYQHLADALECATINTYYNGLNATQSSIRQIVDKWLTVNG